MTQVGDSQLPDAPSFTPTDPQTQQPAPQPTDQTQQPTPPPTNETDAQRRARERAEAEREVKQQEAQRNFGLLPNFNTVLNGQAVPLTPGEKIDLAYHSSVDPAVFVTAFLLAGFSEIDDSHTGYHWGAQGYFKRAGASYADTVDGNAIGNALLPILFHQDPRYFRQGTGTTKSRLIHAAFSTVICHGDNGKRQFNVSNVLGNFISGAISNTYYPSNETGFGLTIENASTVTAEGVLGAIFLEFAPDIQRHLRHNKQPLTPPNTPDAAGPTKTIAPDPKTSTPTPTPYPKNP